ncbi:MAG: hypothetical protein LBR19_06785, partial [Bifidobacteriaceae bacterium]|nr:hypothetical protein [Bifidobacteriaceae bacterium]
FALGVLGVRDMEFVWSRIVQIAAQHGRIAGGDTACGFGNTAMVLAEQGFIPRLFAALVRVVSVVRTLVAVEQGATGPDKDCGYEGPFLKAITGIPISMEGRSAACAHFSPVGNVAACAADLWSNESVQDIKLLSGPAPLVSVEQLIYDTRLLNQATAAGQALWLRDLHAASDAPLDPQAYILTPASVIEISQAIVAEATPVAAAVAGATKALDLLEAAHGAGNLLIPEAEEAWFDLLRLQLEETPTDEVALVEEMLPLWDQKFIPEEYGL